MLQLMVDARSNDGGGDMVQAIPELAGEDKHHHQSSKAELTDGEIMAQVLPETVLV